VDVYWLEQSNADLPAQNDWLSAGDLVRLNAMRFEKRRADWRLGRWTAKCAVAACLDLPAHLQALAEIEIRPASSGAPEVFLSGKPAGVTVSLSHRDGTAICAIADSGSADSGTALGCDLEVVEPRSDAFVADYFTTEEQLLVTQSPIAERSQLIALLWSGKESALKALRMGLRLDTRSVSVNPSYNSHDWHPLHVTFDEQVFHGWWQLSHNALRTMVASPSPSQPIPLVIPLAVPR
jgi:4'-phosphopantetheinyl transferase